MGEAQKCVAELDVDEVGGIYYLGRPVLTKMNEFSEKLQTAF